VSLLRVFRTVLLCAAAVSLGGFGVSEDNPLLGAVLVIAACGGWTITEFVGRGIPRWATNLMLVGLLIGACVRVLQGGAPVSAFNGFLASLLVLKLWERREVRDYGQVLTMSLFLAIGGTLNQSTLGVGITLLLLVPILIAGTMMFQVLAPWSKIAGGIPPDERRAIGNTPSLLWLGSACGLVGLLIAAFVFVTVPRGIGLSQFGRFGGVGSGRVIGFSDQVQLGQGGLLSESQEVVLSLRLFDADDNPIGGEQQVQYLRGAVLDFYDDGRWTADPRSLRRRQYESRDRGQALALSRFPDGGAVVRQQVRLRHVGERPTPLFTLLVPRSVTLSRDSRLQIDYRAETLTREGEPGTLEYTVRSSPDAPEGDPQRSALPRGLPSPRFRQFASELLTGSGISPDPIARPRDDDAAASRIFENYLRTNLAYTRDILAAPIDRDPTEWFLFDVREGHCEYFASALTALCRAVGINARVVTGYVASEFDPSSFEYTVRSSSAHAWVEVEIGPGQWRTMDGTPPAHMPLASAGEASLWRRLARSMESVQDLWSDSVVSFDSSRQSRLFGGDGFQSAPTTAWIERIARRSLRVEGFDGAASLRLAAAILGWLMLAVAAVIWVRRTRRKRSLAAKAGFGPLTPLYLQLLDRFAQLGHAKPAHVSSLRHAERLAEVLPEARPLREAARALFQARFAATALSDAQRAQIRTHLSVKSA